MFLKNYNPGEKPSSMFHKWNMNAFLKSVWHMGIISKGRTHYWMLLLWSAQSLSHFRMAVRFSIYGHHFRKTFKSVRRHLVRLEKLAT
jgi:hypothetical protein